MQSSVRRDASTSEADPLRAVRDRTSDPRYFNSGKLNVALLAAKTRSLAYWKDECDRDLDRLLAHFTSDASVVTPNGIYSEGGAIRGLYRNSFEEYPALSVDVIDVFPGADACCIEYSAVLTDVSSRRFLVEGVNLMRMRMVGSRICDRSKTPRVRYRLGDRRPTVVKRLKAQAEGSGYER
jgi:hypothetical protein